MGILLPVVTWASPVVENPSVDLTVYFESLCPDSIKFVSRDVPAAWRLFGPDLRISFKPFGKASWSHHDPDENGVEFDFECQHGPDECFGNKVLACALWFVEEPALQVPFMECLVKTHEMPGVSPPVSTRSTWLHLLLTGFLAVRTGGRELTCCAIWGWRPKALTLPFSGFLGLLLMGSTLSPSGTLPSTT